MKISLYIQYKYICQCTDESLIFQYVIYVSISPEIDECHGVMVFRSGILEKKRLTSSIDPASVYCIPSWELSHNPFYRRHFLSQRFSNFPMIGYVIMTTCSLNLIPKQICYIYINILYIVGCNSQST